MNQRIKKKLRKRNGHRTYKQFRAFNFIFFEDALHTLYPREGVRKYLYPECAMWLN